MHIFIINPYLCSDIVSRQVIEVTIGSSYGSCGTISTNSLSLNQLFHSIFTQKYTTAVSATSTTSAAALKYLI